MNKLHVFDMDGTLLRGSACLSISEYLGQSEAVNQIEKKWTLGEVGHVEFYELCLPLWRDLTDDGVEDVFNATDWIFGIEEVFADIAKRGEHSMVVTLSPQFFVDKMRRWGLNQAFGADIHWGETPNGDLVLTPESKPKIVGQVLSDLGLSLNDCVAYGDSSSDVPLFKMLNHTVAINGSESLRDIASASYDGWDLRDAYAVGRELLHAGSVIK